MSTLPGLPPALLNAIRDHRIVNAAYVAASAVATFDYFLTLPQEVEHMWPAALGIPKVLFLLIRYYTFVHIGIVYGYYVTTENSAAQCNGAFNRLGYSSVVAHILCDAVGCVRVYGFAGGNRILGAFLGVFFSVTSALELFFLWKFTGTLKFFDHRAPSVGCIPVAGQNMLLTAVFLFGLANLVTVTSIMIWVAYRRRRLAQGAGGLVTLFYRDGIFYFIALSFLSLVNIIFGHTGPNGPPSSTMVQIQVLLNNILTERLLLHLRAFAKKDLQPSIPTRAGTTWTMLGEMVFSSGSRTLVHGSTTLGSTFDDTVPLDELHTRRESDAESKKDGEGV